MSGAVIVKNTHKGYIQFTTTTPLVAPITKYQTPNRC